MTALLNSLARVTSISLRSGVDATALSQAMMGQTCGQCESITSCADAVGQALNTKKNKEEPQVCDIKGGGCATCG